MLYVASINQMSESQSLCVNINLSQLNLS